MSVFRNLLVSKFGAEEQWMFDAAVKFGVPVKNILWAMSYNIVEYIEGHGTQWIDTGLSVNRDLDVNCKILIGDNNTSWTGIIGGQRENVSRSFVVGFNIDENKFTFQNCPDSAPGFYKDAEYVTNVGDVLCLHAFGNELYVNKKLLIKTASYPPLWDYSTTLSLFGWKNVNTISKLFHGGFYYAIIKTINGITRIFIPCINKSNIPCMIELMTMKEYHNMGTGVFTHGNFISIKDKMRELLMYST